MIANALNVPVRVIHRYAEEYNLSEVEAEQHFEELCKFFESCSITQERCAPSEAIDRVWHAFLQFTREYREFCLSNFGRMIDHDPSSCEENVQPYLHTRKIAEQRFGKLNSSFWPVGSIGATICGVGDASP